MTWNEEFKLHDAWYYVSDIRDYFEYILKRHREKTNIPSKRTYANKMENRTTFKIKTEYELLTLETMKLLGNTKSKITKDKNGKNVPTLEITEEVLVLYWSKLSRLEIEEKNKYHFSY